MTYPKTFKIKVLHILPAYFKEDQYKFETISSIGGGERFVSQLALEMSKFANTTLVTFGESNFEYKVNNLTVKILKVRIWMPFINAKNLIFNLRLIKLCRNFNIVHAHQYYSDTTLNAVFAKILFGFRLYITDHGYRGINIARYFPARYFADKMLIQTQYDAARFNLPDKAYTLIYGGVDLNAYSYESKKESQVIFIGRLLPHKGIDYLIDAIDKQTKCVVIGHILDKEYYNLIKEKAKNKNIEFIISPTDARVIEMLKKSSILVLPSVERDCRGVSHNHPELFGLVIAEAFACGTPVIVSNTGALPYVVDNNINGFVVDQNSSKQINERINYLLSNKGELKEFGRRARDKAEKLYNWNNVVKLCFNAYLIKQIN